MCGPQDRGLSGAYYGLFLSKAYCSHSVFSLQEVCYFRTSINKIPRSLASRLLVKEIKGSFFETGY